jgi:hypothetical protein
MEIGANAFVCCSSIKKVVLSANVTSIGQYAFSNCTGITEVTFIGTAEQWAGIEIADGNNPLTSATVTFAAGN